MSAAGRRVAVLSSAHWGGAGIAARRLTEALATRDDLAVEMIDVGRLRETVPPDIAPPQSFTNNRMSDVHFTVEHPGFARGWLVELLSAYDVVNVHWAVTLIALGELDALARTGTTLVFTLHDFLHISGGCHYPGPCTELEEGCLSCPQIDRTRASATLPGKLRRLRGEIFARPNVHLAAPSAYVRDRAVASAIVPEGRAHVLRNPYIAPFEPQPRPAGTGTARILLIADHLGERRKNMALALDALAAIATAGGPRPILVDLIGEGGAAVEARLREGGVPFVAHGRIDDHRQIAAICGESDIVLSPSVEDNWPNVLVEAGVHGAMPVVGPGHGCAEFVRAFAYGEVAHAYTVPAFVRALTRALAALDPARADAAGAAIRAAHAPPRIAHQFAELFLPAAPRRRRALAAASG